MNIFTVIIYSAPYLHFIYLSYHFYKVATNSFKTGYLVYKTISKIFS